jgi:hypothetical protein
LIESAAFSRNQQKGAALVEFSLSIIIFIIVVMGIIEFGRALFLINMAGKATQMATRLATICDISDMDMIRTKVRAYLESSGQIHIAQSDWLIITPNTSTCYFGEQSGNVDPCWITTSLNINALKFDNLMIPMVKNINIQNILPEYRVTQVRESMSSSSSPNYCK